MYTWKRKKVKRPRERTVRTEQTSEQPNALSIKQTKRNTKGRTRRNRTQDGDTNDVLATVGENLGECLFQATLTLPCGAEDPRKAEPRPASQQAKRQQSQTGWAGKGMPGTASLDPTSLLGQPQHGGEGQAGRKRGYQTREQQRETAKRPPRRFVPHTVRQAPRASRPLAETYPSALSPGGAARAGRWRARAPPEVCFRAVPHQRPLCY